MNEFSIGEKVVVNGVIGEVKQIKETRTTTQNMKVISTYEYLVEHAEEEYKRWYLQGVLKHYLNDEISVNKVLINMGLLYDLELAKRMKYQNDELEAAKIEKGKA